jgi:hypothetical protein
MAIRALNSAIVANYDTYANATIFAGDALMLDSNGKVIPAHRTHTSFDTNIEMAGRFVGFSADDTVRSGNTMILADPVGASYTDSSGNFIANNNAFYVVSKRAIGDFLSETVSNVTNPTAGSSGFEGPRRGVAVFNTPGGQFITDRWAGVASSSLAGADGGTWTPAIGDLLAVSGGAGNSGKVVQYSPIGLGGTHGIAVGRVDSYDSATGLLYFTQLGGGSL